MTAKNPQATNFVLVIETQAEFDKAKFELNFLEEKHSEVCAKEIDAYLDRMAELSNAITVYECLSNLKAVEIDIKDNAESFDCMRLYAIGFLFADVLSGERPECIKAQIKTLNHFYRFAESDLNSGILFSKKTPQKSQGFKIAYGSDITPQELISMGFVMKDFKFYPSLKIEVENTVRLNTINNKHFMVEDQSIGNERIYRFKSSPF